MDQELDLTPEQLVERGRQARLALENQQINEVLYGLIDQALLETAATGLSAEDEEFRREAHLRIHAINLLIDELGTRVSEGEAVLQMKEAEKNG
ncbi:MAG: hypothetical protein AAGH60_14400 [Pseudomonadota bacterium]